MSTERQSLQVNELDFNTLKANIQSFLKNQSEFSDYNFEGSGLTVLLDVLSYFTHYQGIYNNLIANELFLDTAVKRSSVVSHAKSLGYTPRSKTAATAVVNANLPAVRTNTLPRGSVFKARAGNRTYNFTNTEPALLQEGEGEGKKIENLVIQEGTIRSFSFVVPSGETSNKFRLPDKDIDTKTLKVQVFTSVSDNSGVDDVWSEGNNYNIITSTTNAYFVEEDYDGVFSIYFGDGVTGRKLDAGNYITVSYLKTNGAVVNGIGVNDSPTNRVFTYNSPNSTVDVVSIASGGSDVETISSIRYNAPKAFASQNRAVTASDFEALITNNFSGFKSVYVYGGENADPPEFGRVLIALKPNNASIVTDSIKTSIENFLSKRCSVSVAPKVVDTIPLYFRYSASVVFDPSQTVLNDASIQASVRSTISDYFEDNTADFFSVLSISRMQKTILDALPEIESMVITPNLEYRFQPVDSNSNYEIKFKNAISHPHDGHKPVISSNNFGYVNTDGSTTSVFLEDDGFGNIVLYEMIGGEKVILIEKFGTVDYQNGIVRITSATLRSFTGSISVYAEITGNRIISSERFILLQDVNDNQRALVTTFADDRPDRRVVASSAGSDFVGTSSISVNLASTNTTTTPTDSGARSTGGGSSVSTPSTPSSGGGGY